MAHEFDGRKYEKVSALQRAWGVKLVTELPLNGHERVLDLGCGDGANTEMIARLVPGGHVVGIDASRGMIDAAKPKERENLQFILMNIEEMQFEKEFDVIFSNAALHWVKDHRLLLGNVLRALKTDGFLRFNFAGKGNCPNFLKVIRKAMALDEFAPFFKEFDWPWYMASVDDYEDLVKNCGLRDSRVWIEDADYFFPDTGALTGWIEQPSIVPLLEYVPEKRKTDFRDYVVEAMIKETLQTDGRCFETFRRINLYAKR